MDPRHGLQTNWLLRTALFHYLLGDNPEESKNHLRRCESLKSRKKLHSGADKSLTRPTSQCILFDVENISFDVSLVVYIYLC